MHAQPFARHAAQIEQMAVRRPMLLHVRRARAQIDGNDLRRRRQIHRIGERQLEIDRVVQSLPLRCSSSRNDDHAIANDVGSFGGPDHFFPGGHFLFADSYDASPTPNCRKLF